MAAEQKDAARWLRQCSKHLGRIEHRLMEGDFLGHEVVRQICILLEAFNPKGDWGWLLRRALDIAVRTVRQMTTYYMRTGEEESAFMRKAILVMRLFFEEGWHRTLLGSEGKLMKSAMCSLIVSMKGLEADILRDSASDLGFSRPSMRTL